MKRSGTTWHRRRSECSDFWILDRLSLIVAPLALMLAAAGMIVFLAQRHWALLLAFLPFAIRLTRIRMTPTQIVVSAWWPWPLWRKTTACSPDVRISSVASGNGDKADTVCLTDPGLLYIDCDDCEFVVTEMKAAQAGFHRSAASR